MAEHKNDAIEAFSRELSINAVLAQTYKDHLYRLMTKAVEYAYERGRQDGRKEARP